MWSGPLEAKRLLPPSETKWKDASSNYAKSTTLEQIFGHDMEDLLYDAFILNEKENQTNEIMDERNNLFS